jgi:hypothetical protein
MRSVNDPACDVVTYNNLEATALQHSECTPINKKVVEDEFLESLTTKPKLKRYGKNQTNYNIDGIKKFFFSN